MPFRKLLVALDLSVASTTVWKRALEIAQPARAQILVTHIFFQDDMDLAMINGMGYGVAFSLDLWEEYQQHLEAEEARKLRQLRDLVQSYPLDNVTIQIQLKHGIPGQSICQLAKTWGADLIVLGRRGHSGLEELLLGSVSNYVLHHAPCSVLAVQGEQPQDPLGTAASRSQEA
ncbi:MAG: universal stress protein [Thermostichales cyanobacterium BF3_bins_165]